MELKMGKYKRMVSIGAHPLDAELQGGPLMIKYAKEGAVCTFVHVVKGRLTDPGATEEEKRDYEETLKKKLWMPPRLWGAMPFAWIILPQSFPQWKNSQKKSRTI